VIAAGGDGTAYEVVNGLLGSSQRPRFAVLPLGPGNDVARAIPPDGAIDAGVAIAGNERRYFVLGVGVGFIGCVNRIHRALASRLGGAGYYAAAALSLARYRRGGAVRLTFDDLAPAVVEPSMVVVNNTPTVAGGFLVAPRARINDGLLDCYVSAQTNPVRLARLVAEARGGRHEGDPLVRLQRAQSVSIESSERLPVHVDGEVPWPDGVTRLRIESLPGALTVMRLVP
jgi:diacylglycerol kinase family enzyme